MSEEKSRPRVTRASSSPIKVYCLPDERANIAENASRAGLSMSSFLLEVGQGYEVTGVTDYENVRELARINGDLGRLGGLLKLWLTDDERTAQIGVEVITALLIRIEQNQAQMAETMKKIVRPRAE